MSLLHWRTYAPGIRSLPHTFRYHLASLIIRGGGRGALTQARVYRLHLSPLPSLCVCVCQKLHDEEKHAVTSSQKKVCVCVCVKENTVRLSQNKQCAAKRN